MAVAAYNSGGKRNIIVLGKTGSGKSTLANKVVCHDRAFKISTSFESCTTLNVHACETVEIDGRTYCINMIDTVGFKDAKKDAKRNSEIIKEIKKELKIRVPEGLNLMIFVLRLGRFTEEEHSVFKKIVRNFGDLIKDISLLVITGCDGKSDDARNKIIKDFKENALTKQFAEIMTKGIYCVALPDISELNEEVKKTAEKEIDKDMTLIRKVIVDSRSLYLQEQIEKKSCMIL